MVGAELCFLPPYRPDPNPIEMAFSKFNTDLKRRAARAVTELREAIGHATDIFTPTCAAIVGVLREREHVALNERRFVALERGRAVTAFLEAFFARWVRSGARRRPDAIGRRLIGGGHAGS